MEAGTSRANRDLEPLAEIIVRWVDPLQGAPEVYLFGSRVRGDHHRPDSDIDVRLYLSEWAPGEWTYEKGESRSLWWMKQEATEAAELRAQLQARFPGARFGLGA
jgi:hypothetical protein